MDEAVYGSELLDRGLTPGELRWRYKAVLPGVYIPRAAETSIALNAHAAWLSTDRTGIIAGKAAAALHGSLWVDADTKSRSSPTTADDDAPSPCARNASTGTRCA